MSEFFNPASQSSISPALLIAFIFISVALFMTIAYLGERAREDRVRAAEDRRKVEIAELEAAMKRHPSYQSRTRNQPKYPNGVYNYATDSYETLGIPNDPSSLVSGAA